MKSFYPVNRLLQIALVTVIPLTASLESASGQRHRVMITFANETTETVVVRRITSKGKPAGLKPDTAVSAGASAKMRSFPGESFLVLLGKRQIGQYTATDLEHQKFPIARAEDDSSSPSDERPAGKTGSKIEGQQAQRIVDFHNQKREEVGVGPVTWSPQIAQFAQTRADTIARTKKLAHLPRGQNAYGENIAQGGSGGGVSGFSVVDACEGWYAEKAKMPKGTRVMTVELFNGGVGHYTQMVWKESTEIGAGIAHYQQNGFAMTVVVCCYDPPGNFIGGPIY